MSCRIEPTVKNFRLRVRLSSGDIANNRVTIGHSKYIVLDIAGLIAFERLNGLFWGILFSKTFA